MSYRLQTKIWIDAQIRTGFLNDRPVFVLHKGDPERGGVLLKLDRFDAGIFLYELGLDFDGNRIWRSFSEGPLDPASVADRIGKKRSFDSDLWVLEIEDRKSEYELDAPLESL